MAAGPTVCHPRNTLRETPPGLTPSSPIARRPHGAPSSHRWAKTENGACARRLL